MDSRLARRSVPDRVRWALGSIALLLGLASVAAATHDGPWTASPVATLDGTSSVR